MAITTWSMASPVFVVWTAANMVTPARANHRRYEDQFPASCGTQGIDTEIVLRIIGAYDE